jgi:hypothetical protein
VFEIDDLVEPGAEEIGLSAVASFLGSHVNPRLEADEGMESRPEVWINLPEKASTTCANRQT